MKIKRSMKGKRSIKIKKTHKRKYRGGNFNVSPWYGSNGLKYSNVIKNTPTFNNNVIDPPINSNKQFSNQKGGGFLTSLMPQDLVNAGRSLTGGIERGMNSFQGVSHFDSSYSSPTQQPSIVRDIQKQPSPTNINMDINEIHRTAGNKVATFVK